MKPLIGITGHRYVIGSSIPGLELQGVVLSDDYTHGVEAAGGIPVVIPITEGPEAIAEYAQKLDGFLLSGGDDMDPMLYGEEPRMGLGFVSPERDAVELELIRHVMRLGKPMLGICRGLQVLNVALGGTLYQDLPREWKGSIQHKQKARRDQLTHSLHIESGSRVHNLLGRSDELRCNSFHHQSIRELASDLVAVAWDEEGLVEAVEHPDYGFLVAVQWHPENLWRMTPVHLGLFQGLVEAARR